MPGMDVCIFIPWSGVVLSCIVIDIPIVTKRVPVLDTKHMNIT